MPTKEEKAAELAKQEEAKKAEAAKAAELAKQEEAKKAEAAKAAELAKEEEAKKASKEIPALFIKTKPGVKSFWRAGHSFSEQGYGIALDLLTAEQINALKNEPMLIVEECSFPQQATE